MFFFGTQPLAPGHVSGPILHIAPTSYFSLTSILQWKLLIFSLGFRAFEEIV